VTTRRLLALDIPVVLPRRQRGTGFHVLPQRGDRLDERLAAAFDDAFSDAPLPER
jgi:hypothetical protein